MVIGKSIWNEWFNLGNMEYGVDEAEFIREMEMEGIVTYLIDYFIRAEVSFGELSGWLGGADVL